MPGTPRRDTVIFDLGGVLIDWDPRHLYRKLFPGDAEAMERFLSTICTGEWNRELDAGLPFAEATARLRGRHPEQAAMIDAYHARWPEMIAGPIAGTVAILRALHAAGTPLYGLTNWSHETYPVALERFDFMALFRGVVVSGEERIVKPDPRIYRLLLDRFGVEAGRAVYIDDNADNAAAATALGLHGIHFTGPEALRTELAGLGLPPGG